MYSSTLFLYSFSAQQLPNTDPNTGEHRQPWNMDEKQIDHSGESSLQVRSEESPTSQTEISSVTRGGDCKVLRVSHNSICQPAQYLQAVSPPSDKSTSSRGVSNTNIESDTS